MSAAPKATTAWSFDARPPEGGDYAPVPVEQLREMAGIELFHGIMAGKLPGAPIAQIMNMWIQEAEPRSEEHTSELQSLMRNSYAVFSLKKKKQTETKEEHHDLQRTRKT